MSPFAPRRSHKRLACELSVVITLRVMTLIVAFRGAKGDILRPARKNHSLSA